MLSDIRSSFRLHGVLIGCGPFLHSSSPARLQEGSSGRHIAGRQTRLTPKHPRLVPRGATSERPSAQVRSERSRHCGEPRLRARPLLLTGRERSTSRAPRRPRERGRRKAARSGGNPRTSVRGRIDSQALNHPSDSPFLNSGSTNYDLRPIFAARLIRPPPRRDPIGRSVYLPVKVAMPEFTANSIR